MNTGPKIKPSMILGNYQAKAAQLSGISKRTAWEYIKAEVPEHFKQPVINHLQTFNNSRKAKK